MFKAGERSHFFNLSKKCSNISKGGVDKTRGVHGYGSTREPEQLDPTRGQKFGLGRVIGFVQVEPD